MGISLCELAGMGGDGGDEGGGALGVEAVELFKVLMHFGDGKQHCHQVI